MPYSFEKFRRFQSDVNALGELVNFLDSKQRQERWRQVGPGVYATRAPNPSGSPRRTVIDLRPVQAQLREAEAVRRKFEELAEAIRNARTNTRR